MEDIDINAGYAGHLAALREAFPGGNFSVMVRVEIPESEPGADDKIAGNMDLGGVDAKTAVNFVQMARDQQQAKVRAERAQAVKEYEEYAASVERMHAPIIHLPGGGTHKVPDAHLIQAMAMDRQGPRPPLAWG